MFLKLDRMLVRLTRATERNGESDSIGPKVNFAMFDGPAVQGLGDHDDEHDRGSGLSAKQFGNAWAGKRAWSGAASARSFLERRTLASSHLLFKQAVQGCRLDVGAMAARHQALFDE